MKIPVSPKASAVVPVTSWGPATSVPVVVIAPLDETVRPAPPPVNVAGPMLPVVVSWSAKAADPATVTEPEVGVAWLMVTVLTVRV